MSEATGGSGRAGTAPLIAVFGGGGRRIPAELLDEAERLGRLLAEAGWGVMTGGYAGTMEAASRGARLAGGDGARVVGVTMDLFSPRLTPNRWLTEERRVSDFFPRLRVLTSADAFVVLRGSVGTLTEAMLAWTLLQTGQLSPRPFLFVGESWRRLFEAFLAETFVTEEDLALATVVGTVDEAVDRLREAFAPIPPRPSPPGRRGDDPAHDTKSPMEG